MIPLIERVTVPEGSRGAWSVKRFDVSEKDAKWANLRAAISGGGGGRGALSAGTYTQLHHAKRGIVMSDTPDEIRDHYGAVYSAQGHVLINGLGIGMVLGAILKRPGVDRVTVVEIDADVCALVGPHYASERLEIVNADAFAYSPPKGVHYGAVWHDIWDDLCADNLPEMTKLKRKYARRCEWQGCWGEAFIRRHR